MRYEVYTLFHSIEENSHAETATYSLLYHKTLGIVFGPTGILKGVKITYLMYTPRVYTNHMKSHYEDVKEHTTKRINIIKGQLDGLLKMIENDEYCIDLLNQSLAIQNSIKSLDAMLLERHLKSHVAEQFSKKPTSATEELLKLFKRVHK